MPERQPRKQKEVQPRKTQFSEVTIAAWTGEISGQDLYDPRNPGNRGGVVGMYDLNRALPDLSEGGYVIDLRPLADHPKITEWVFQAPMSSGKIEGQDIDRLPENVRQAGADMAFGLEGAYKDLALLAATKVGEPMDGSAGPFDYVSAQYRAVYWGSRGALIGKRVGNTLHWSDGKEQVIGSQPDAPQAPQKPRRGKS